MIDNHALPCPKCLLIVKCDRHFFQTFSNLGARPKLKNQILTEFNSSNLTFSNGISTNGYDENSIKNRVGSSGDSEIPKPISDSSVISKIHILIVNKKANVLFTN